jgi:hypothetical protein
VKLKKSLALCFLATLAFVPRTIAAEKHIDILPLSEVKAGMLGEAHTVFQGTTPESFKVRVISILPNFLPKQDIILIRAEDPRVESTGIAAGMSGSPVYIDGKLMGAIAYGWAFAKEPLAGVTPIESMLAMRERPDRPPDPYEAKDLPSPAKPGGNGPDRVGGSHLDDRLLPLALPLSVSGASEAALAYLGEEVRSFGLHPVRGGAAGKLQTDSAVAKALVPGAAVGVTLIQGDMSTTAMGTLTYTDGRQALAFGHPMFGIGAVKLPMVFGQIHAIIPSLSSSLKMASPLAHIGSITDDSKNGVVGLLNEKATMVPVSVRVVSKGVDKPPFAVEIARHRRLLPMLATMAVSTALTEAVPDIADMFADVTTRLFVRGFAPIELRDQIFSNENLAPRVLAMSHGMRALNDLLGNPFAPAVVEKIEIEARVDFRADAAEIVAVSLPGDRVWAGSRLPLRITLRPYGGGESTERLDVEVPSSFAGHSVKIEIAGGAQAKPEIPRAESLQGFIDNLRLYYPASAVVVSMTSRDDGASLHGRVLRNLPPSALDTLRSASQTRSAETFRVVKRTPFLKSRVFSGRQEITVHVRDPKEKALERP